MASKLTSLKDLKVIKHHIPSHGLTPNTSIQNKPLLIYRSAFPSSTSASQIEAHLSSIGVVTPQWRYTMYSTSHFHTTSHEVLGIASGTYGNGWTAPLFLPRFLLWCPEQSHGSSLLCLCSITFDRLEIRADQLPITLQARLDFVSATKITRSVSKRFCRREMLLLCLLACLIDCWRILRVGSRWSAVIQRVIIGICAMARVERRVRLRRLKTCRGLRGIRCMGRKGQFWRFEIATQLSRVFDIFGYTVIFENNGFISLQGAQSHARL